MKGGPLEALRRRQLSAASSLAQSHAPLYDRAGMATRANRRRQKEEQHTQGDEGDDEEPIGPLFEVDGAAYLAVTRTEPEEGYLGRIKPNATEQDIARKWGGGTFVIAARGEKGTYIKNATRTVEIAGDPVFKSQAAEARWRREQGLEDPAKKSNTAAPGERPLSVTDLMLLSDKAAERAREQTQMIFAQITALQMQAHSQQLEAMRAELARRDQATREEQARRDQLDAAERDRNREFLKTMVEVRTKTDAADPVSLLFKGIELAKRLGGDGEGPGDPLALLTANLPQIIAEGRKLLHAERAAPPPQQLANPGDEDEYDDEEEEEDEEADEEAAADDGTPKVELTGDLAVKFAAVVERLQAQGADPETTISHAFDIMAGKAKRPGPPAAPPAAPTSSTAPAAAAPEPPAKKKKRRPAPAAEQQAAANGATAPTSPPAPEDATIAQ